MCSALKYGLFEKIGKGSQARVYKVTKIHKTQNPQGLQTHYAMKVFSKKSLAVDTRQRQLFNEIRNQRKLRNCQYVIQILKIYESDKFINLLLEYSEEGNLADYVSKKEPLSEKDSLSICWQLLSAVDQMNKLNIIHRDLKPENIMIHSLRTETQQNIGIKIADFGFSIQSSDKDSIYLCGTPGYQAPESLRSFFINFKTDIFSIGVILYNLLTGGKNLFDGISTEQVMEQNKICSITQQMEGLENASPFVKLLLERLLDPSQEQRISACEAMDLEWVKKSRKMKILSSTLLDQNTYKNTIFHIQDFNASLLLSKQGAPGQEQEHGQKRNDRLMKEADNPKQEEELLNQHSSQFATEEEDISGYLEVPEFQSHPLMSLQNVRQIRRTFNQ